MSCSRGKATPDAHTQRRLFSASAGYCQNPNCLTELFADVAEKSFHIAEMAHVFAANDTGPRSKPELDDEERGAFENLIVLCANCHTMIDKAPETFTDSMIHRWKTEHAFKLKSLFGAVRYDNRAHAREVIEPILDQNRIIFQQYGPHIEEALNPESGADKKWKRKMLTCIIPNNHRVLSIVDINRHLLRDCEKIDVELFRQHNDDLEAFHIEGTKLDASRFPEGLSKVYED